MRNKAKSRTKSTSKDYGVLSIPKTGKTPYLTLVEFLKVYFETLSKKILESEIEGYSFSVVDRGEDYLLTSIDYDAAAAEDDPYYEVEFDGSSATSIADMLEEELQEMFAWIGDNGMQPFRHSKLFQLLDDVSVEQLPGCCGMSVLCDIPTRDQGLKEFIVFLKLWMLRTKNVGKTIGEGHISLSFTHQVRTPLYKALKNIPGIKIAHTWKNLNSGNELFLAVVSPEDYQPSGSTLAPKKSPSPKKRVAS